MEPLWNDLRISFFLIPLHKLILIMAKPIETTPILTGDDAVAFIAQMEKGEKASREEVARVMEGAIFIESALTFNF